MNKFKLLLVNLCFVFLLTACGFHLRGVGGTPAVYISEMSVTVIGDPSSEAVRIFQQVLRDNKLTIVNEELSPWHVTLSNFQNSRTISAVGIDGRTRNVSMLDGYTVSVRYNDVDLGSLYVNNSTTVEFSSAQFIGDSEEEAKAHIQLARENANAALRYINSRYLQLEKIQKSQVEATANP